MLHSQAPKFEFPKPDERNAYFLPNFTLDVYRDVFGSKQQEYFSTWRQRMPGCGIISIDAGFKVHSGGMTTVMTGEGYILNNYMGTSSLRLLSPAMALREAVSSSLGKVRLHAYAAWFECTSQTSAYGCFEQLCSVCSMLSFLTNVPHCALFVVQPTFLAYVDNPASSARCLQATYPSLGYGLYNLDNGVRDSGVRGDLFHLIALIKDSCTPNHPSWTAAQDDLLQFFKLKHPVDQQAALAAQATGEPEPTVRYLTPPPHVLLPKFLDWATRWLVTGVDITGVRLFTLETLRIVEATYQNIINWYYSGERNCHDLSQVMTADCKDRCVLSSAPY